MKDLNLQLDILIAQNVFGYKFIEEDTLRFSEDGVSGDGIEENAPRILFCFKEVNGELIRAPYIEDTPVGDFGEDDLPEYSTDLEAAFEIFEIFKFFKVGVTTVGNVATEMYFCEVFDGKELVVEVGTSIPHAICRAALKAKGITTL